MKIFEFTDNDEPKLNFDSIEDLCIFMRNDPMFYRKQFFPCMANISDKIDSDGKCDPNKDIGPCVDMHVMLIAINMICHMILKHYSQ